MPSLEFLSKFECHGSIRLKTQSNLHFIRHYFLSLSPPFVLFPQSVVLVSCVVNQFKKLDGYRALRNKSRKEENVETCGAKTTHSIEIMSWKARERLLFLSRKMSIQSYSYT
jgi:hypothetical protein